MKKGIKIIVKILLVVLIIIASIIAGLFAYEKIVESKEFTPLATESYVEVDGYNIWYRVVGKLDEAEEVSVFLHGFNVAASMDWQRIEPYLNEQHAYIMFDFIGMGQSQRFNGDEQPTEQWRIENIKKTIDAIVGKDREYNLIGASYGGSIALLYADAFPEKVKKIIVIAPIFFMEENIFISIGNIPFGIGRGMVFLAMGGGFVGDKLYASNCSSGRNFCPTAEELEKRHQFAKLKGTTKSFLLYNRYTSTLKYDDIVKEHAEKLYVIYGEEDVYFSETGKDKILSLGLTPEQLYMAPRTDHVPYLSAPEITNTYFETIYHSSQE